MRAGLHGQEISAHNLNKNIHRWTNQNGYFLVQSFTYLAFFSAMYIYNDQLIEYDLEH